VHAAPEDIPMPHPHKSKQRPPPHAYDHLWPLLPVFIAFVAVIVVIAVTDLVPAPTTAGPAVSSGAKS
jgi:hypothetical protein